jgi:nucleotide-binding universal stress UspA family protein
MYKKILVPLDGSPRAEAILPHVEDLALHSKSEVALLRVIEPSDALIGVDGITVEVSQRIIDEEFEASENYLKAKQGELCAKGIQTRTYVKFGPVVQTILDIAQAENADLIALASHGRTGLARIVYGSVAAGVLQQIDRPLLLIRAKH